MDWVAFSLSISLATATVVVLLPLGILLGRTLAYRTFKGRALLEAGVVLPLVMPPTVLGYYLLQAFGQNMWLGRTFQSIFGFSLNFSFTGLVLASLLFNLPFMVQPIQRAFEGIPLNLNHAARLCGLNAFQVFMRVELPLAWRGLVSAVVLTFVHTLGEFGVVLMIGGNIPGDTRTLSIAIYDSVQGFNMTAANQMSLALLGFSMLAVLVLFLSPRPKRRGA